MIKHSRRLALLVVVAHWIVVILHLFIAAQVLPGPKNSVSGLGIILLTAGHLVAFIAVWKLGDKASGALLLIFFLAAMGADLYEHFLNRSPNNIFLVAPGSWTPWFDVSVFVLLALEILGCLFGTMLLGRPQHLTAA